MLCVLLVRLIRSRLMSGVAFGPSYRYLSLSMLDDWDKSKHLVSSMWPVSVCCDLRSCVCVRACVCVCEPACDPCHIHYKVFKPCGKSCPQTVCLCVCVHYNMFQSGTCTLQYKIQKYFMLVGMTSKISTHTSAWIAQHKTESRVPKLNVHTNQIFGILDSAVFQW